MQNRYFKSIGYRGDSFKLVLPHGEAHPDASPELESKHNEDVAEDRRISAKPPCHDDSTRDRHNQQENAPNRGHHASEDKEPFAMRWIQPECGDQ
jgi:hypothetical protein